MNIYLVIPTIRTLRFLKDWKNQFQDCHIVIIEDHATQEIETPKVPSKEVIHYTWKDVANDFGPKEWVFSRKNAGIRSYGFWKSYQRGADVVITLDDDCYPVEDGFIERHIRNLNLKSPDRWVNTYPHPDYVFTRGIPYSIRDKYRSVISHGLWTNKIDLDGQTEINFPSLHLPSYPPLFQFIPKGVYFPMCSMNLAFTRDVVPLMYFPLMGLDKNGISWGYDRFDDIWAGIFAKKIIDHLGLSAVNGSPFIEHRKASDVRSNILKEKNGMKVNESLWRAVDVVSLTMRTPESCYRELAEKVVFPKSQYFQKLKEAMIIWANLFI